MQIATGPVSLEHALEFANELEEAIGEVANGRRKVSKLPIEPMARLIQFVRDQEKRIPITDERIHQISLDVWTDPDPFERAQDLKFARLVLAAR